MIYKLSVSFLTLLRNKKNNAWSCSKILSFWHLQSFLTSSLKIMANVTCAIFRSEEHGGVRRDKPELPVHVCRVEKIVVLHGSWSFKTNQWFINSVATGGAYKFPKSWKGAKKRERHRDSLNDVWEKERERERKREKDRKKVDPGSSTIFFSIRKRRTFGRPFCRDDIYLSPFETNYRGCSHATTRSSSFDH